MKVFIFLGLLILPQLALAEGATTAHSLMLSNGAFGVFDGIPSKDPVGKRPAEGDDFRPVVAMVHAKGLCSATVFFGKCALTAGHCIDGLIADELAKQDAERKLEDMKVYGDRTDEERERANKELDRIETERENKIKELATSQHIFLGESVFGNKPHAKLVDYRRHEAGPKFEEEMKNWYQGKISKYNQWDVAVVKFDKEVPAEYSLSEKNLPGEDEIFEPKTVVQGVGYGLTAHPEEELNGKKLSAEHIHFNQASYVGRRTSGDVEVFNEYGALVPNRPVKDKKMHFVLHGDSGGPLWAKRKDGTPMVYAVNSFKNYKGWGNKEWRESLAVSTRWHRKWIMDSFKEMGCMDK